MANTPSEKNSTFELRDDAPAAEAVGPIYTRRGDYGGHHGRDKFWYYSNVITPQTRAFVSVSEGQGDNKFVGAASMSVENVAARNGVVEFRLFIDWPSNLGTVVDFLFVNP
ncbi:hypothetical protein [Streptomyces aureoversilis]|uniref:Uncharacterized protein n=1 Tax=Streptomyces aureoversilis TaxID=67277 RepID=A0ABV9ZTN3_9ACTN